MSLINPFKALRPIQRLAHRISTPNPKYFNSLKCYPKFGYIKISTSKNLIQSKKYFANMKNKKLITKKLKLGRLESSEEFKEKKSKQKKNEEFEIENLKITVRDLNKEDISSRNLSQNILGYGHGNFGVVRDQIKSLEEFSKDLRPTGPHNSFLFVVLDYGFLGLILFLNIFLIPFIKFLSNLKVNMFRPEYLFLGTFVALSFTGDFIQNHSISVIFFVTLFKTFQDISNE